MFGKIEHSLSQSYYRFLLIESFKIYFFISTQLILPDWSNEQHQDKKVNKHGACVIHYNLENRLWGEISNAKAYLCTAADLATQYNMGQYLKEFQLGKEYSVGQMIDAIQKQIGVVPDIDSLVVPHPAFTARYLYQICLYFDKKRNLINSNKKQKMDEKFTYLPCENNLIALDLPRHNIAQ